MTNCRYDLPAAKSKRTASIVVILTNGQYWLINSNNGYISNNNNQWIINGDN